MHGAGGGGVGSGGACVGQPSHDSVCTLRVLSNAPKLTASQVRRSTAFLSPLILTAALLQGPCYHQSLL